MAANHRPQGCVVLLVHERPERRLGTRDRLFRNGYTVLLAGTLSGTRNLLAEIMPASAVVDMGSNVEEYCEDMYSPDEQQPVARGAAWNSRPELSSSRAPVEPDKRCEWIGFRCVLVMGNTSTK